MLLASVHRVRIQRLLFSVPVTGDVKAVVARATSRCHLHRSRAMHFIDDLVDVNPSWRLVIDRQAVLFYIQVL